MENVEAGLQTEALEFKAHSESINQCQYLLNDSVVATCSDDKTVAFWRATTGDCLLKLEGHQHYIKSMDVDESRHHILTASWDKSTMLHDYHTEQKLWVANHESLCTSCHVNGKTNMAVVGCDNNHFYLWDLRSGDRVSDSSNKQGHSNTITCCRLSHDGLTICTTSMDKSALIWDMRMLKPLLKLSGHINIVSSCDFSSHDHYLCTASWDKTVRVYDISAGSYRSTGGIMFAGHNGCVSACEFSKDDSLLMSCGYDFHVVMYNMNTRGLVCSLKGHKDWINDVHVSTNKRWILTCARDGFVKIWDTELGDIFNRKTAVGIELSKCEQCGRMFSTFDAPDPLANCLCVFCRLESPQRSLEQILAPLT